MQILATDKLDIMISIIQIRRLRITVINDLIQPAGRIRVQIQTGMTQTYYPFSTQYATQLQNSYLH